MSADRSPAPVLEVHGLVKAYGGVRAIDGLDFAVEAGELHCIIGPNGAGKSTLFKLLIGTERPSAGTVLYRGHTINNLKSFERARLGLAIKFQDVQVYQDLTVFQNLFIPLRRHHRPKAIPAQISDLLGPLHLAGTEREFVASLSHGQQQWLAIGMSMAVRPKVLLLDEPTAGMSPEETRETAEIVRGLNATGVTVIVIEHDMEFVRNLNSRTTVLHYGKVFAQGTFGEIESDTNVRRIYLGSVQDGP